jgi:hypothetical protein
VRGRLGHESRPRDDQSRRGAERGPERGVLDQGKDAESRRRRCQPEHARARTPICGGRERRRRATRSKEPNEVGIGVVVVQQSR